ncbi:MAG TPA: ester cyclase [Roseiflexaceae bacterium]|nr:ester cyclase [Roseiflexaceae bacterium]
MSEANKALAREFFEAVWNQHNPGAADTYFAADYVDHNLVLPGQPQGVAGARAVFESFIAAFPDVHFTIDTQLAEGDMVATRWTATGTNSGPLMGMPPSGKPITVTGIDIVRIAGGKIAERWGMFDGLAMMQQVGAIPAPQA